MARGAPTDAVIEDAFRADYLMTGNASKSARTVSRSLKVKLNERTARDLAAKADEDPEFAKLRRGQRARYLEESIASRQEVLRLAVARASAHKADVYHFEVGGTVVDRRPDWANVVLAAEKNAHNLAKLEGPADQDGNAGGRAEVTINIRGPATASVSG